MRENVREDTPEDDRAARTGADPGARRGPGWRRSALALVATLAAAFAASFAPRPAAADVDVLVGNGNKVVGTLDPGDEVETFRLPLPRGAKLTATAKSATKGPALRLRFLDPAQVAKGTATGRRPVLTKTAATTGVHAVEVTSKDGVAKGGYEITFSWKSPRSRAASPQVGGLQEATLSFAADAAAKAAFSVAPAYYSNAVPALVRVTGPDGYTRELGPGRTRTVTLPAFGDYVLRFKDTGGAGGKIAASVVLTPRKVVPRTLTITSSRVPRGVDVLATATVGSGGGVVELPSGSAIQGGSIEIPSGALTLPTPIFVGVAPAVDPADGNLYDAAGPSVFFGPEGLDFKAGKDATITLPFDPAVFPDGTARLRVYTRDAAGVVTEVTGFTVGANSVSFPVSHFSAFQVVRMKGAVQTARLFRAAAAAQDGFAESVAADAQWIAVGGPLVESPTAAQDAGSVQVYPLSAGVVGPPERVDAPNPVAGERFGFSVGVSGDVLVVGAPLRDTPSGTDAGAVFVYRRGPGSWLFEQELRASQGHQFAGFGGSVDVDQNRIVVGTSGENSSEAAAGAAYVYEFTGAIWVEAARLVPSRASSGDQTGTSVAIWGDVALVGLPFDDVVAEASEGSAAVFARDAGMGTWPETDQVLGSTANELLGWAVAIDGQHKVFGSIGAGAGGGAGRVQVYVGPPTQITFLQELVGPGGGDAQFGTSLSIAADTLLVGALGAPGTPGKAFAYRKGPSAFVLASTMPGAASGLGADANFGESVAVAGTTLVVGAVRAGGGSSGTTSLGGAAFVFDLP